MKSSKAATIEQPEAGPIYAWLNAKMGHMSLVPWPELGPFAREQDAKIASLEAERDRLREALAVAHEFCCDFPEDRPCTTENCQIRAALEGTATE